MTELLDRRSFEAARERISGRLHRTPLLTSRSLEARVGAPVYLKCENLQKTGSFKVRGALNSVASLDPAQRARGVVTISAGNHAQAVAWAAAASRIKATVVMPEGASPPKVEATKAYGGEVILHGTAAEAFREAFSIAERASRERCDRPTIRCGKYLMPNFASFRNGRTAAAFTRAPIGFAATSSGSPKASLSAVKYSCHVGRSGPLMLKASPGAVSASKAARTAATRSSTYTRLQVPWASASTICQGRLRSR